MVSARRGASSLGCLVSLLIVSAVAYFGVNAGEVYLRYYRFEDAMKQEALFASRNSDDVIVMRLRSFADSLELPEAAQHIGVRRGPHTIQVWSEYYDHIELPLTVREVHFAPRAESPI
jgi:hypothetical protein